MLTNFYWKNAIKHICDTLIKFEVHILYKIVNFCFNKIITLANISNSLEIEFEANPTQDSQFLKSENRLTKLCLVIYSIKIEFRSGVVL